MAAAVAADKQETGKKGPSFIVQMGLLVGLTVIAAGIGWVTGGRLAPVSDKPHVPASVAGGHGEGEAQGESGHGEEGEEAALPSVLLLDPMTVNLAAPSSIWARLEVSLVFDGPGDQQMADTIHQDFLAYLRTVKLEQLESASGFQHLKTDLEERAEIRSSGKVKRVLVKSLLFE